MPSAVNGYSLNVPGEAADWSPREFNLLSAFAGLMPTSGTRIVTNQHEHSSLYVLSGGTVAISASNTGVINIPNLASGMLKATTGTLGIATSSDLPAHTQDWTTITNTPTTIAGYGITDGGSGGISGNGNINFVPFWNGTSSLSSTNIYRNIDGSITVSGNLSATGNKYFFGNSQFGGTGDTKFGIGVSPSATLHVKGDADTVGSILMIQNSDVSFFNDQFPAINILDSNSISTAKIFPNGTIKLSDSNDLNNYGILLDGSTNSYIKYNLEVSGNLQINGNIGIGAAPSSSSVVIIPALDIGKSGQIRIRDSYTNNFTKSGYVTIGHFTNSANDVLFFAGENTVSNNKLFIGGGIGYFRAATDIEFWLAPNTTTNVGTIVSTITSKGLYIKDDIYTTQWQTYSPAISGWSSTSSTFQYKEVGDLVFVKYAIDGQGDANQTIFSAPVIGTSGFCDTIAYIGYNSDWIHYSLPGSLKISNDGVYLIAQDTTTYMAENGSVYGNGKQKWLCGQFWYKKA